MKLETPDRNLIAIATSCVGRRRKLSWANMEMHPPRLVAARPQCLGYHRRRLLPMNGGGAGNGVGPVRELIMINRGDKIRDIDYKKATAAMPFIVRK